MTPLESEIFDLKEAVADLWNVANDLYAQQKDRFIHLPDSDLYGQLGYDLETLYEHLESARDYLNDAIAMLAVAERHAGDV